MAGAFAITLEQAVEQSVAHDPALHLALAQVDAAAAGLKLARTRYLPRADLLAQINRATRNNVFGMLLPQGTLPGISGPPLASNSLTSVWGTATGVLISWEPFDFGLRKAEVEAAEAVRGRAVSSAEKTRLEVATATADAFLTLLAAQQTVRSAQSSLTRSQALAEVVQALVQAQLRPGADAERARAEVALAQTQLILAEQASD